MERLLRIGVFVLSLTGLAGGVAAGQGLTGQIGGTVVDKQGGGVPAATVTARNTGTQTVRDTVTNIEGAFVIPNVIAGTYELKVTMSGFKTHTQTVTVTSTERVAVPPITLEVGGVNETVEVQAEFETAHVQSQSGERSATLSDKDIQDIGLRGRDYLGALKTLPGVVDTSPRDAPGWNSALNLTINGQSNFNLSYDGITNKDTGFNGANYASPSLDSIAEIKVLSSNFQAEYGRTSGATIAVITKSGSSRFSGSAAYFKRHEALNSNPWDRRQSCSAAQAAGTPATTCDAPRYRYDNSAFTFGGPVLIPGTEFNQNRDKLFFFYSLDMLPRTDPLGLQNSTMPTQRERNGDFSQTRDSQGRLRFIRDPNKAPLACNVNTGGSGCFDGNIIPADRINKLGQAYLNLLPLPNATDPTGNQQYNYQWDASVSRLRRDHVVRVDYNIRPGTTFYTREQFGKEVSQKGYGNPTGLGTQNQWPQMQNEYDINTFGTVNTLVHTMGARSVLEVTAGMNWSEQVVFPTSQAELDKNDYTKILTGPGYAHVPFYPDANPLDVVPNASFGGTNALPSPPSVTFSNRYPFTARNPIRNITSNFTHLRGNHNLKAGLFVELTARPAQRASSFNGSYSFNSNASNPYDTNLGYANAMAGTLLSYTESTTHPFAEGRYHQYEFFAQDNWRVNRKLTLDYGLRMVYMGATHVADQTVSYFDPAAYNPAKAPKLYIPVCQSGAPSCSTGRIAMNPVTKKTENSTYIGKVVEGTGDPYNGMVVLEGTPPQFEQNRFRPSPRLGFAYDVMGDGKTAVRGGYGITYDRYQDDTVLALVEQPPLVDTFATNWTTIPLLQSSPFLRDPRNVNAFTDIEPLTVHSWSISVQRELPWKILADVGYVGNTTRNTPRNVAINNLPPEQLDNNNIANMDPTQNYTQLIPNDFRRPYQGYGTINELRYFKNGPTYQSFQLSLTRRLSNGFAFSAAYTGSQRCGLNGWDYFRTEEENQARWTNCNGSRPHNLVISYNYLVPDGSALMGHNPIVEGVFDGWQLSGVTTMQGGTRQGFNVSFTGAPTGDLTQGLGGMRPTLVCDPNLPRGEQTRDRAFRTECVRPPGPSTNPGDTFYQGTSTNDEWVSLGFMNHDITLFKNFRMTGGRNVQFRVELYNAFNTSQFTQANTNAQFNYTTLEQTNAAFGTKTNTRANSARVIQLGARYTF